MCINNYPKKIDRVPICGTWISNVTLEESVQIIKLYVTRRMPVIIVTPNIDHIIKLQKDAQLREIYRDASLVLCDGVPLIWASKFFKTPLKGRVNGTDLFVKLCEQSEKEKYRMFFLGGRPGSVSKAAQNLKSRFPNLNVVKTYSPPFGFEKSDIENNKVINLIRKEKPDILFVGLGAPKQEKWIHRHYKELKIPVSIGIGASFEFVSGIIKRAPVWMQRSGLEWFWRLLFEPKRLWKRYLIDDIYFFILVLKQKLKRNIDLLK